MCQHTNGVSKMMKNNKHGDEEPQDTKPCNKSPEESMSMGNLKEFLEIEDRYFQRVEKYKKQLKKTITISLVIIGTIIGFLGWVGVKEVTNFVYERTKRDIYQFTVERIETEFQEESIRQSVKDAAIRFTQQEAKQYIADELEQIVNPFRVEMKESLEAANFEVEQVKALINTIVIAERAKNGSRKAYFELQDIRKQETVLSEVATLRLVDINRDLMPYHRAPKMYGQLVHRTPDGKYIDFKDFNLDELVEKMNNLLFTNEQRHTCMVYIKKKPKEEILHAAIKLLKTSDYLHTCAAFCGVLAEMFDYKFEITEFEEWIKFCEKELNTK